MQKPDILRNNCKAGRETLITINIKQINMQLKSVKRDNMQKIIIKRVEDNRWSDIVQFVFKDQVVKVLINV